ncbi:MAG: type II toxin-antitoxin system RelE/ParE family toxin [Caldisericia bacterium]|nr:type II toxin-antitoxin system RelE/ParE family toxin [Caldisericia bacterium]
MKNSNHFQVIFYISENGIEPVRKLLQSLKDADKKIIGEDIKTLQYGWPIGMPLSKKIDTDLWEIRSKLLDRILRVLFTVTDSSIVLLHGYIKKSNKLPLAEKNTAKKRLELFKKSRRIS